METHLQSDCQEQLSPQQSSEQHSPGKEPASELQSMLRVVERLRWQVRALLGLVVAIACVAPIGWVKAEGKSTVDVDEISADRVTCTELVVGNGKGSVILLSVTDDGATISLHRKSDPKHRSDENYPSWSVDDIGGKATMSFTDTKQSERLTINEDKSGKFGIHFKDGKGKQVKSLTD